MNQPIYYYLCPEATGGATLHKKGCFILQHGDPRIFLGTIYTLNQAISLAKRHRPSVHLCRYCLGDKRMNRESS